MRGFKIYKLKNSSFAQNSMKSGTTLLLFLVGAFVLVAALIEMPSYTKYTGEIFILLFLAGLIFALGNAIREGQKFAKKVQSETTSVQSS